MGFKKCPLCSGAVLEDSKTCYDCTKLLDVSKLWALKREAKYYLEKEIVCLEDIEKSYKITKSIYNPYHKEFAECYDKYKTYYFHIGDFDKSLEYFLKFLEIEKKHWGEHSIKLALNILGFLDDLKSHQNKNVTEAYKGKVKQLSNNVKEILPLHYPDEIVNYDEIYTAE
ncbi:hypothetical protein QE152_g1839 [Popillia japonica]|uniref:Uncharacterized protein n=1 Tax=Popillia japonica TaxID=7064 RepID=A0AAW1N119_POPJA